jgi:hypothetical protein
MLLRTLRPAAFAALALSLATQAEAAEPLTIKDLVIATSITAAQEEATLKAVRAFYAC